MTVPISKPEKASDKEKLVSTDVAAILPTRIRLVRTRKHRFLAKLLIAITILFLIFVGIFITVCYLRRIGPFHRVFNGRCMVGERRYNRNRRIYESYQLTNEYALINVPSFRSRRYRMEAVKTLHVYRAKMTVIQMGKVCFIKKMNLHFNPHNWYFRLHHKKSIHMRMSPFRHLGYKLEKPMIPDAHRYLHRNVHQMAAAMCITRSVYRLVPIESRKRCPPVTQECLRPNCVEKSYIMKKGCKICVCKKKHSWGGVLFSIRAFLSKDKVPRSSNTDETKANDKTVHEGKALSNNFRVDDFPQEPQPLLPSAVKNRAKRSAKADGSCKKIGIFFEGITPLSGEESFVDTVYDC